MKCSTCMGSGLIGEGSRHVQVCGGCNGSGDTDRPGPVTEATKSWTTRNTDPLTIDEVRGRAYAAGYRAAQDALRAELRTLLGLDFVDDSTDDDDSDYD